MMNNYRAAAIGRTGRGDYGHDLDVAFRGLSGVQFVAVADSDPEGLRAAGERIGAERLYSDYREMLEKERPDLVSVCPRWVDCHAEMVMACADAGVKGIFCEKPFARTLAEADAMIDACDRSGARLVVAHRRASPYEQHAKTLVDEGVIGEVQVMRGHGKADDRAGAEDLMVLGTHMMDSMRFFAASDVAWAHGHVAQGGQEITADDIHDGAEGIGLLAGGRCGRLLRVRKRRDGALRVTQRRHIEWPQRALVRIRGVWDQGHHIVAELPVGGDVPLPSWPLDTG